MLRMLIGVFAFAFAPTTSHHAIRHTRARHRPVMAISKRDLCVANRENGEPGALTYSTIHWHAVNEYDGAYSFLPATWDQAGGQRYAARADEASPGQQSAIFERWSHIDPGAWPNTLPPCLRYP